MNDSEKIYGMETVALINGLLETGITRYVALIRHSVREIDQSKDDLLNGLTEEGRQAAFEFGKSLLPVFPICFYSSFVGRSKDTAAMMEKGYGSVGGEIKSNIVLDKLAGFYIKNKPEVMKLIGEMIDNGNYSGFYQNWFEGKIPADLIMDAKETANEQLRALLNIYNSPEDCGHICVSHDQNLYLINQYFLGISPERRPEIDYMEGVVLFQKDGAFHLTGHYFGPKQLEI